MKEHTSLAMWASLIVAVALLAGCAGSMKMLPDGTYVNITTVGDTLDRSASVVGRYKVVSKKPDGTPVFEEVNKSDLAVGPTVGGQIVIGVTGGVAAAATQGAFGLAAARVNANAGCRGATCGTTIINDGSATAAASSTARARLQVGNITCGATPCTE